MMKTPATLSMIERILFLRRVPLFGELEVKTILHFSCVELLGTELL